MIYINFVYIQPSLLRYDGTSIENDMSHPLRCHTMSEMGSSRGRPVLIEGGGRNLGTEIMDMTTLEWSNGPTQPFH